MDSLMDLREITGYGHVLRRMTTNDLEQVRIWRNLPHVRLAMDFQDEISAEQQQAWYAGLDPSSNLYCLISEGQKDIGIIHIKNIDLENGSGEAGIFVGEKAYLGTQIPVVAVLAMMDYFFLEMEGKQLQAKVNRHAEQTLEFNRRLGYQAKEEQGEFIWLVVNKDDYLKIAAPLRKAAARLSS